VTRTFVKINPTSLQKLKLGAKELELMLVTMLVTDSF
jgi:hypothetical protein